MASLFDQTAFRNILWIGAATSAAIAVLTVAVRFSVDGASRRALVGTPLSVIVAIALVWKAVSWRRTLDGIVGTKDRLDDMGLQNPIMDAINYEILLGVVIAGFVAGSALPLVLYFVQCG
jgi:hypothetical protein